MSMNEELADTHAAESADLGGVTESTIPAGEGSASDKPLSLRETLNKSISEVREKEDRARDTSGKFAKEASAPDKAAAAAKESPDIEPNVQPDKPVGPPSSWSKESKATWESLPAQVKADAIKREAEVARGFEEYKGKTAQLSEIQQALAPVRHIFQQNGIQNEAQAVKRLLDWEGSFRNPQTRLQAFHALAQQYGVDLSQFAQRSEQSDAGQNQISDQLRPVIDQFGNVAQRMNMLENELNLERQSKVSSELITFAKDKPHFEKVRVAMGQLLQAGLATDLESAYQKAVWADPEVRNQFLKEEDDKRKAEFEKSRLAQANKARSAAISPSPRARQGAPVNGTKDASKGVRGSILASINQLQDDQRA